MQSKIIKNTSINMAGQITSASAAVLCMPALVHNLGAERMSLLTIIWVIIGYFNILDFGMGMAVTNAVSKALATNEVNKISSLFWGAVLFQFTLATVGGFILFLLVPAGINYLLINSPILMAEANLALTLCIICLPFLLVASSVVGLLQAAQRFDLTNAIQAPLSVLQYIVPLVISFYTKNLGFIVLSLLLNRIVATLLLFTVAVKTFPNIKRIAFRLGDLVNQIIFGGWLTITNILSPLMVYFDRFVIAIFMPITMVAYYTIPLDAVMKLSLIPNSLSMVLFSVLSYYLTTEQDLAIKTLQKSLRGLSLILFLPISLMIVFSFDGLLFWLGPEFAHHGGLVLQIFLLGIWSNSLTRIPYAYVLSNGKANFVVIIQVIQIPILIILTIILIKLYGLPGAAAAWSLRLICELFIYLRVVGKISNKPFIHTTLKENFWSYLGMAILILIGLVARGGLVSWQAKVFLAIYLLVGGGLYQWYVCLRQEERNQIWGRLVKGAKA